MTRRVWARAGVAIAALAAAHPALAQDAATLARTVPAERVVLEEERKGDERAAAAVEPVDVQARFESFQREFVEEFGGTMTPAAGRPPEAKAESETDRLVASLESRWQASSAFRLYQRLEGVYERLEGVYDRIELSTRWASHGVTFNPDLESAFDGRLRLHVDRRVGRFDMGFDVDDAMNGKLGLRFGGRLRGYDVRFDVDDIVNEERVGIQIRRIRP